MPAVFVAIENSQVNGDRYIIQTGKGKAALIQLQYSVIKDQQALILLPYVKATYSHTYFQYFLQFCNRYCIIFFLIITQLFLGTVVGAVCRVIFYCFQPILKVKKPLQEFSPIILKSTLLLQQQLTGTYKRQLEPQKETVKKIFFP